MDFALLPETDSIMKVLLRPPFAASFCTMSLLMLAFTYFSESWRIESSSALQVLVYRDVYFDVLSFTGLMSITIFCNSYQITRSIATGQSPPLRLKRLEAVSWPLSSIFGCEGDRNIVTFVVQMLCIPGSLTLVVLYGTSYCVNGGSAFLQWSMPLSTYLAASLLWRLLVFFTIFTINYIAAHNSTQSVLIPTEPSDGAKD